MTLFAVAIQVPSRMDKDRVDMAHCKRGGIGDGPRWQSGRRRCLHEAVVRLDVASHPGASAPFEAHSLMFARLDRRCRMTRDAGKPARQSWIMRFDQKL